MPRATTKLPKSHYRKHSDWSAFFSNTGDRLQHSQTLSRDVNEDIANAILAPRCATPLNLNRWAGVLVRVLGVDAPRALSANQ